MSDAPKTIYLKDYQPSAFSITKTHLCFELDPHKTIVTATLQIKKADAADNLQLNGDGLRLLEVQINGENLAEDQYDCNAEQLVILSVLDEFELTIKTEISPVTNTTLMGLYNTDGCFCTQCEAEGFRKITYYLDRPDVMSEFTTKIIGDKDEYPVMLSNGNPIEQGELDGNKHYAVWHDPFVKPCYLFALVAGQLEFIEDSFTTMSGRDVMLRIYTESSNIDKCDHAMTSIKKSMKWDEENYGREYDLDLFMIVAVNHFNFGAMENKGLNIFNARFVLASPATATDWDYAAIDTVVAHEYFHNWSGDRVTLRDWFQISLKEGFTVYREQSFDEDNISKTVHRIDKANELRNRQFPEDAGPMAHAVRPESFVKIDNFYTSTVYNKGSEVIRMYHTILGDKNYRAATDEYFDKFDGMAATTDDFFATMQAHCEIDLTQFGLWYKQAGTPEILVSSHYDAGKYSLTVKQVVPDTAGQTNKKPMMMPLRIALLDENGKAQALANTLHSDVLLLTQEEQTFNFENISANTTPSLLRHFSAPVKLSYDYSVEQLAFLVKHDSDGFSCWEAGQKLALYYLKDLVEKSQAGEELVADPFFLSVMKDLFNTAVEDKLAHAQLLTLPSEQYIIEQFDLVNPVAVHVARSFLVKAMALYLEEELVTRYHSLGSTQAYRYDVSEMGRRKLRNVCLSYLVATEKGEYTTLAKEQFDVSLKGNMTDCMAALSTLVNTDSLERVEALSLFYDQWQEDSLVLNKWLAVQATSSLPHTLDSIKNLTQQDCFSLKTPNNVYSLIRTFAALNNLYFHAEDGSGYQFIADQVIALDRINPMVAARIVEPLTLYQRVDMKRQSMMKDELSRILEQDKLSSNLFEHVNNSLNF